MTFTASNGVELDEYGYMRRAGTLGELHEARKEFYQHLRDEELGRWRWPENPDYVVYPDRDKRYINQPAVIVVNETNGATAYCGKDGRYSASGIGASDVWCEPAARAYFDAHPETKPWHDAKPGEVWALITDESGTEYPWGVGDGGEWVYAGGESHIPLHAPVITAGRRIWPEAS